MTAEQKGKQATRYTGSEKLLLALLVIGLAFMVLATVLPLAGRDAAPSDPAVSERKFPNPQLRIF
jgi:hypothetical protein